MFKFLFLLTISVLVYANNIDSTDQEDSALDSAIKNTKFKNTTFYTYFKEGSIDDNKYLRNELWTQLLIKNKIEMKDDIELNSELVMMYHNSNKNQHEAFTKINDDNNDNTTKYIDLNQFYLTMYYDNYDIYVGKKIKSLGLSEIYSPTNIFSRSIASTPQHVTETGIYNFDLHYYLENDDKINFAILPFNTRYGTPYDNSRWIQGTGDSDFYDLPEDITIDNEKNNNSVKNYGLLLQYSGVVDNIDYYTFLARSKSLYPILEIDEVGVSNILNNTNTAYTKKSPLSHYAGLGFMSVVDENKFYGDIIYQNTLNDMDQDFIKYNFGFKHRATDSVSSLKVDEIALTFEYANEYIVSQKLQDEIYKNSENSRVNKNNVIFSMEVKKDHNLSYIYSINYSFKEYDRLQNHTVKYNYNDNLDYYVSHYIYKGNSGTHFGRWNSNDNLEIGFTYNF